MLFRIGLVLALTGLVLLFLRILAPSWSLWHWDVPCPFYTLTGLYCPGCGGQRAVKALLGGKLLASLHDHPLVLPLFLYGAIYLVSQGLNRLTKGRTAALCFQNWHLYFFLGLLVLQWIAKNLLLAIGQYHFLSETI